MFIYIVTFRTNDSLIETTFTEKEFREMLYYLQTKFYDTENVFNLNVKKIYVNI